MPRPAAQETIDVIMNAGERRIRAAGYSGFSFREIAAEIGVTSASIHYHFPTKDALAAAIARRYNARIAAAVERDVGAGMEVVQVWRSVFREALADGARMCLCGSLGAVASDLSDLVAAEVRHFFDMGVESLVRGGLTRDSALQVLATLEGAILMASARGDAAVFDQATAGLVACAARTKS